MEKQAAENVSEKHGSHGASPEESLHAAEAVAYDVLAYNDDGEVFKVDGGKTKFRALGLFRTVVVLVKLCFATGVLSIPSALSVVGYGPGVVLLALWSAVTICRWSRSAAPLCLSAN